MSMKTSLAYASGALSMLALLSFVGSIDANWYGPAIAAAVLILISGATADSDRPRKKTAGSAQTGVAAEPILASQIEIEVAQALKNMGATKNAAGFAAMRAAKASPAGTFEEVFKLAVQFSKEARA